MANNVAYIEKTLPGVIDKVFARESLTEPLIQGGFKLDFTGARTVKIFRLEIGNLKNYNRGGHGTANETSGVRSYLETFTLSQERSIIVDLDKLDELDDDETILGSLGVEIGRTKVIPEVDAYRFSKLAGATSTTFGNRVEEDIAENTIIAKLNNALKWFDENKVPVADRICYVSPDVMNLIRSTNELYRKLSQSEYKEKVSFEIYNYNGMELVVVPSDEFYTDIAIGDGYGPSTTSKAINFLCVDKKCVAVVKKLDFTKVYSSDNVDLGFAGHRFFNLYYHDIFVPSNKLVGVYCSVSKTKTGASVGALARADISVNASGKAVLNYATAVNGTLVEDWYIATSALAVGAAASGTKVAIGGEFTKPTSAIYVVGAVNGKVVACSTAITVA